MNRNHSKGGSSQTTVTHSVGGTDIHFCSFREIAWLFGVVGNCVSQINKVATRWTQLVLGWVTIQD